MRRPPQEETGLRFRDYLPAAAVVLILLAMGALWLNRMAHPSTYVPPWSCMPGRAVGVDICTRNPPG